MQKINELNTQKHTAESYCKFLDELHGANVVGLHDIKKAVSEAKATLKKQEKANISANI